jgi:hypothetical protein
MTTDVDGCVATVYVSTPTPELRLNILDTFLLYPLALQTTNAWTLFVKGVNIGEYK